MNGNQIKGFVKYNEIEYGFFFADEELLLFPCNEEQRQKDTPNLFDMLLSGRPQPRKVIRKILISGTTSDGKNVTFQVSEEPGNDNGYLYFQVYAIYLYTKHHHVYAKDLSTQSSVANRIEASASADRTWISFITRPMRLNTKFQETPDSRIAYR